MAKSHLDAYKHVFVACIYEDHWEDKGPGKYSMHHFKAMVVRTYKGDWNVSERGAFLHSMDAPASSVSNAHAGELVFVCTNEHKDTEVDLDAADWGSCNVELEYALQLVYPQRDSRRPTRK